MEAAGLRVEIKDALKGSKKGDKKKFRNLFRWHDMRHDFASQLAMAGVNLAVIKELLGHSSYQMVTRYAHISPESQAAAVAKLESVRDNVVPFPTQAAEGVLK